MTQLQGRVISVFGSARIHAGSRAWQEAEQVGALLAHAGATVMTGGYGGVMEAASKGAREAGGHVIGVTVSAFEKMGKRSGPNPYIDELIHYDTLSARLLHVVKECDGAVACDGGIGTLSEVSLMWSLVQTGEMASAPIILLGDRWQPTLDAYMGDEFIAPAELNLLQVVRGPHDVIPVLADALPTGEDQ